MNTAAKIMPSHSNSDVSSSDAAPIIVEYRSLSPVTFQRILLQKGQMSKEMQDGPWSELVFGTVVLADISGFTKLASSLCVEELKYHINHFFTDLLGKFREHGGDVVKFCGDAVLVIWTTPVNSDSAAKQNTVFRATRCVLDVLETCGHYEETLGGRTVSLRLHCGLSAGELYCMCLGDENRMEALIAGRQLRDLSQSAADAEIGKLCISMAAYEYIKHVCSAIVSPNNTVTVIALKDTCMVDSYNKKRRFSLATAASYLVNTPDDSSGESPQKRQRLRSFDIEMVPSEKEVEKSILSTAKSLIFRQSASPVYMAGKQRDNSGEVHLSKTFQFLDDYTEVKHSVRHLAKRYPSHAAEYQRVLERFVHESARGAIAHNTSNHLAELRVVVTLFIQIVNLDDEFDKGEVQRPQQAIIEILEVMQKLGGALRQYVVDDKGCVVICSFGVPGFSSLSDDLRAVYAAILIREKLTSCDISCRIGISRGMVYCGYVGSFSRKEYCMMGSSVNLAARLMGLCCNQQIIVSSHVYLNSNCDFVFTKLPKVVAKGYDTPVQVYSLEHTRKNPYAEISVDEVVNVLSVGRRGCFVGRDSEMSILQRAFTDFISAFENSGKEMWQTSITSLHNSYVVVGCEGSGKTRLVTEFVDRNDLVIPAHICVTCHLANVLEPYEVCRQLLRAIFDYTKPTLRRSFHKRYVSSSCVERPQDVVAEEQRYEHLYDTILAWVTEHMSDVLVESSGARGEGCLESIESEDNIQVRSSETVSVRRFLCKSESFQSVSASTGANTHFRILEVLPLLQIVLDIESRPNIDAMNNFSTNEVQDLIECIVVTIMCAYTARSPLCVMVLEELQWADKPSFKIIKRLAESCTTSFIIGTIRPAIIPDKRSMYMRAESFEGGVVLNSVEDVSKFSDTITLKPLTKSDVRDVVQNTLGPVLLACMPNALSDASVTGIFHKSNEGVAGLVVKYAKELESSVAKMNFDAGGTSLSDNSDSITLEHLDNMCFDNQIVLKLASVCGTFFTRNLLQRTLVRMGYCDSANRLDQALADIEGRGLIQRVAGADYYKDGMFRISSLRNRISLKDSGNKTYSFVDKKCAGIVYGIMLENQRQVAHSIVASLLADNCDDAHDCDLAAIEVLAFHYSRANVVTKEVYYTELAARSTEKEGLLSTAYNYYHHLFALASGGRIVEHVIRDFFVNANVNPFGQPSRRVSPCQDFVGTVRYILPSHLKGRLSSCVSCITNAKMCHIITQMSVLMHKMHAFRDSHNLSVLALHCYKLDISLGKTHFLLATRMLDSGERSALSSMLYCQSITSVMRGHMNQAEKMVSMSLALLSTSDYNALIVVKAMMLIIYVLQGKKRKISSLLLAEKDVNVSHMGQLGYGSYQLSIGIYQAARGDFKLALVSLAAALSPHAVKKDHGILKFLVWNTTVWSYLALGRVTKAEDVSRNLDRRYRECNRVVVWSLWVLSIICILRGDFKQAKKHIKSLDETQQGRSGRVHTEALKGFISVCRKDFLGLDSDVRDRCFESVLLAGNILSFVPQLTPIGLMGLFLSGYSIFTIISKFDFVISCRRGGGVLHRLRKCAEKVIAAMRHSISSIPCLLPLYEALVMMKAVVQGKRNRSDRNIVPCYPITNNHVTQRFNQFSLGLAFWHLERVHYCEHFGLDPNEVDICKSRSLELFKLYGMNPCHPVLDMEDSSSHSDI